MAELQAASRPARTATEHRVAEMGPWFQNIHLPDGTQTAPAHPLGDFPGFKWQALAPHLPDDLSGQRVLELGCNAGFYAQELARRGARVEAVELDPHYLRQARWAAEQAGVADRIHFRQASVYEVARESERYDGILFMGLFYHLRHPVLALDGLVRQLDGWMVFQSLSWPEHGSAPASTPANLSFFERQALAATDWPHLALVENRLADDPTNWWVPNPAANEALLRSAGLEITGQPLADTYLCRRRAWGHEKDAHVARELAEIWPAREG